MLLKKKKLVGLPSSGLHTNGYSLARKVFFDIGGYSVKDKISELESSIGLTLLKPHINYTNHLFSTIDAGIDIHGIAHVTGGGIIENLPRILPSGCAASIQKGSWPVLDVFNAIQSIGGVSEDEMFRAFNMGIGMIFIINKKDVSAVSSALSDTSPIFKIGEIVAGNGEVEIG